MIRTIAFALITLLPGAVYALGLGKLDLQSGLNEPFNAHIEILSPTVDEIESLKVGLADADAFARAGIDLSIAISKLRFNVVQVESGADYIRVYSTEAVREPFLNFLMEVNWSRGRLFREYTVLLDPPTYSPELKFQETITKTETVKTTSELRPLATPTSASPAPVNTAANTVVDAGGHAVVYNPEYRPSSVSTAPSSSISYSGGDYTTSAGDTLWGVASGMRPDSSVSVQQMMMALYRANPEAFVNNNINGLKRGQVLSMPDRSAIESLNKSAAVDAVKDQNSLWDQFKGAVANEVTQRPESPGISSGESDVQSAVTESSAVSADPELRLVGAEGDSASQGTSESGIDSDSASKDLVMAQESLVTLEGENRELKDKLVEAESIIDDLKSLIALKEDELNALKQQIRDRDTLVVPEEIPAEDQLEEFAEEVMEEEVAEEAMEEMPEEEMLEEEAEEFVEEVMEEEVPEEVMEEMAEEEMLEEEAEEVMEEAEEMVEAVDTTVTTQDSAGMMSKVNDVIAPAKDFVMSNLALVGGGLGGIVALLLGYLGFNKMRQNKAEVVEFGESDIMDFENIDDDPTEDAGLMDIDDSESPTVLPDEEDDESDVDITPTPQMPDAEDDKTQIAGFEETETTPMQEEEPEEDPLAEVNVFLAYEHFDQAADFVKSALEDQPDNLDFHTKLLEVYYAANDKQGYEEAAKVLNEKVSGEGEHWDMAVAMWSEMSPNRALFEEREDGLDDTQEMPKDAAAAVTGGIVDLTAEEGDSESATEGTSGGLDFDIGEDSQPAVLDLTSEEETDESMESTLSEASDDEDMVLDITSNDSEEDDMLDLTSAEEVAEEEGLLDVTAAVGLDDADDEISLDMETDDSSDDDDDVLDLTGGSDDEILDVTSGAAEDLLDVSSAGGEDLLDVTAATNLEPEGDEDLLDVTTASTSADTGSELLDESLQDSSDEELGDTSLDFDVEGLDLDLPAEDDSDEGEIEIGENSVIERAMDDEPEEDNVLDFDLKVDTDEDDDSVEEDEIDLDLSTGHGLESVDGELDDDLSVDLDLESESEDETDDLSLDLEIEADEPEVSLTDDLEIGLDDDEAEAGGIELDLTSDLNLEEESSDSIADDFEIELDMDSSEDDVASSIDELDIDMDGTVEMPKMDFIDDDDEEDDEQKTVFVPRSSSSDEQSLEDEISTKLDLAKAYVELGDNDSAKTILDEIITEGNDDQKQQAEELLKQV